MTPNPESILFGSPLEGYPIPQCREHIRVVILDWDGVCYDSLPAAFAGTAHVLRQGGSSHHLTFEEYLGQFDHTTRHQFFKERGVVAEDAQLTEWFLEEFKRNAVQTFPDLTEGIETLLATRDPEVELVIISGNAHRQSIMNPLKRLGVAKEFQAILHGVHDKAPVIRKVLDDLGAQPEEAAIVGDFVSDMVAGYQAGLGLRVGMARHPILGRRLQESPATSRVVAGFEDLPFALFG